MILKIFENFVEILKKILPNEIYKNFWIFSVPNVRKILKKFEKLFEE